MKKTLQFQLGKILAACAEKRAYGLSSADEKLESHHLDTWSRGDVQNLVGRFLSANSVGRALYFSTNTFKRGRHSLLIDVTQTVAYPYNTGVQRVTREILEPLRQRGFEVVLFKHLADSKVAVRLTRDEDSYINHFHAEKREVFSAVRSLLSLGESLIRLLLRNCLLRLIAWVLSEETCIVEMARGFESQTSKLPSAILNWLFPEVPIIMHGASVLVPEVILSDARLDFYRSLVNGYARVYFVLHDLLPLEQPEFFGADPRFHEFVSVVNSSSGVVCESETTRRSFERWRNSFGPPHALKISCAYLASSFEKIVTAKFSRESVVHGVCVGTFEPRKNQIGVLLAVARLVKAGCSLHMTFIGNPGWNSSEFFAARYRLDPMGRFSTVKIALSDAQLLKELRQSDFFIQATFGEGFGLPALEALSQGLPGIVSAGGSLSEISQACGGCLECDPHDSDSVTEAIRKMLAFEDRRELADEIEGIELFSWDRFAGSLADMIEGAS